MKNLKRKLKKQGGFTLVEMLIVVAIIAILVAVSIPLVNASLEKARQATDDANLRAAKADAMIMYINDQLNGTVGTDAATLKDNMLYDNVAGTFISTGGGTPYESQAGTTKKDGSNCNIKVTVNPDSETEPVKVEWVAKTSD